MSEADDAKVSGPANATPAEVQELFARFRVDRRPGAP